MDKKTRELAKKVWESTIASDITPSTPTNENGDIKFDWTQPSPTEEDIRRWTEAMKNAEKVDKPVTMDVLEKVALILNTDLKDLMKNDVYWRQDGKIAVRSPHRTWMLLCGREWAVDLDKGEYRLSSMS